ncbi:hypothetical protein [Pararcticibacter amylolyticus]|uniref:O-antigen ligase domain-containing protein n=1 Tax=Pararcticibacter amylolyticus TaxID=2173175 RepID=A0A2U2PI25_9SPHI|nr:hypothetical protein [Pararcticibacter amylolyticus]PWG81030.1 hypothetical protein DDR33_08870 [Pararcticibacter amylolyticus]
MKILYSILLFFAVFGPKIGLYDTTIPAAVILLILTLAKTNIVLSGNIIVLNGLSVFLFVYSGFICLLYMVPDSFVFFRSLRCLISTACISLFVFNSDYRGKEILNLLVFFLMVNSFVILLQILSPSLQQLMAPMTGFDKDFSSIRAFGLTPGYDSAGYLCIMGLVFAIYLFVLTKKTSIIIIIYTFVLSGLFTGRSIMMLIAIIVSLLNLYLLLKGSFWLKVFASINFAGGLYLFIKFILPILITTIPFLSGYGSILISSEETNDLRSSFSTGSGDDLAQMYFLPDSFIETIFGRGVNPHDSDAGYIKIIHMIGIIGLVVTVLLYIYMYQRLGIYRKRFKEDDKLRALLLSTRVVIILIFFFNIKTLYFTARNFHEIIVISFVVASKEFNDKKRLNYMA